jgi:hypothetical protein
VGIFALQGGEEVKSYSTVTCNSHDVRCCCSRNSPTVASPSNRSNQSDSCSGLIRSGIQKALPRPACGARQQNSCSRSSEWSIRKPRFVNRVVVLEFRRIVRTPKFWDVVLEGVLGVGRERVRCDDIVDRALSVRATLESIRESTAVGCHSALKALLFARSGRSKGRLKRFGGGRRHNYEYGTVSYKCNRSVTYV